MTLLAADCGAKLNNRYGQNATDYDAFLTQTQSVRATLVNGVVTATAMLSPHGESWNIDKVFVRASSATLEAVATTYRGTVADSNFIENTVAGSTGDTTDTPLFLRDGEQFWVVWTGGDLGASYVVTISGWRTTPQGGFRGRTV